MEPAGHMTYSLERGTVDVHPSDGDRATAAGDDLSRVLDDVLRYARRRGYAGPDYCDGMSSRILRAIPADNKWLNLAVQETVKRAPVNLRPLLLVEHRRNYKGTALFAMANLNRFRLQPQLYQNSGEYHADEAEALLDWLVENQSTGYSGFCGGHSHPIQRLDGKGLPNDPDVVSTSYAVKALLSATDIRRQYADVAETAADFLVSDLDYRTVDEGAKIDYHLNQGDDYYTLNAGAIGARLLVDLYDHSGTPRHRERATAILDHVVSRQTPEGGWYYRDPPSASHLSMDPHHNGFIIESLVRYRDVLESDRYDEAINDSIDFFRRVLFEDTGAPNWDESSAYPRDIHAAAQGILVFTYVGNLAFARRIIDWTLDTLYAGDGRFYYRKHRYFTKRITLMRWCQAWMAYAISEYLAAVYGDRRPSGFAHYA